jgi:transketolase
MNNEVADKLQNSAFRAAVTLLLLSAKYGNGHVSSAISCVDILLACLKSRDLNSQKEVILSKGHAATAWYATLFELGYISTQTLLSFSQNHSPLGIHLTQNSTTGSVLSTGSLGHGLSFGAGMAFGSTIIGSPVYPIVIMGDGEINEGSVWEAAQFAGRQSLGNLTTIIDINGVQAVGEYDEISANQDIVLRWSSHGWKVIEIDTVSAYGIHQSLQNNKHSSKPVAILCDSRNASHFSFFRRSVEWHYRKPTFAEIKEALPPTFSAENFEELSSLFK